MWSSRPILVSSSSSRPSSSAWSTQILRMQSTAFLRSSSGRVRNCSNAASAAVDGGVGRREDAQVPGRPALRLAVGRSGPVAHLGEHLLDHAADQIFGHLHGRYRYEEGPVGFWSCADQCLRELPSAMRESHAWPAVEKIDLARRRPRCRPGRSPRRRSGSFSVSGVSRALEPWQIRTISSRPAPSVSTTTNVRPVGTSRSRALVVDPVGLDGQELVPGHRGDLLGRHHAAGHRARNIAERSSSRLRRSFQSIDFRPESSRALDCRATTSSSLVGTVQTCDARAVGRDPPLGRAGRVAAPGRGSMPNQSRSRQTPERICTEFSPIPPVKTMASAPPSSSRKAPR